MPAQQPEQRTDRQDELESLILRRLAEEYQRGFRNGLMASKKMPLMVTALANFGLQVQQVQFRVKSKDGKRRLWAYDERGVQ